ncbi:MAG: amidase [Holophagales bacterium]|nr:amidase [Holophagales bacterium]MYD21856.1 amidase [Holophagales bacterium]MYI31947.1 amidase [Holophagales bacterium]
MAAAGALGAAAVAGSACAPSDRDRDAQPGAAPTEVDGFALEEVTIAELGRQMAEGERTSREITDLYLARIEALDRQGPTLRAVIETNPDALEIAEELDRERAGGIVRGPLHGVPILLKDNISTADRTTTTAGSLALEGSIPPRDAFVAVRLRQAGAVLLGKANLSEWANFRSNRSSSGWSARGGQCRNPYVLSRNPCGSSSGSGAATSANLCAAAVGTETDGSIICPSSANGLVGIKPTVGLVSRSGVIPISAVQDTAGPMARTVADAAALLGGMTGEDPLDQATAGSPVPTDLTRHLSELGSADRGEPDAADLSSLRIGIGRQFFDRDGRVDAVMEEAIETLRSLGAEIVDPVEIAHRREVGRHEYEAMLYEFKAGLNEYLAGLGDDAPARTLADVIAFNEAHAAEEMPYFGQEILIEAEAKGPLSEAAYRTARDEASRLSREEGLDAVLAQHRLDAILGPSGGPAWVTDLVHGDGFSVGSSGAPAVAGYPNVTVPAGHVHGLPVGVSFFGAAWSEPTLIRIAWAFERAAPHRRPPRFHAGVDEA